MTAEQLALGDESRQGLEVPADALPSPTVPEGRDSSRPSGTTPRCPTCAFADEHGHHPHSGTHCRRCHRDWWGTAQMHCVTCHHHFTSASSCHRHQRNGSCIDPRGALSKSDAPIFSVVDRKGGPAWALAGERDFAEVGS